MRFADRPEIYKSFLQILSDFKKKTEKECTSNDICDVYDLDANLFQTDRDLLSEFTQFLRPAAAPAEPRPRKRSGQKASKLVHTLLVPLALARTFCHLLVF